MSRFALAVVVLLILFHGGSSSSFDPATHQAVLSVAGNWTGTEEKLAGLDVYVSGSLEASEAAVIMVSDVFGWKVPLFRKLADKVARNGYYVVAPDFFHNDPLVNISDIDTWILRHPMNASVEPAKEVVLAVKAKGISSVGLAGFCWGGKVVILTGNSQKGLVNAIVQLHPAPPATSDYATMVTPIMILAAPTDQVQNFTSLLESRKKHHVKVFVKIFKDVVHGWTVRYNESDPRQVYRANRAHGLMLKWFHKYL